MRTDDDRVSRFEGDHGFENRGGSGVGRRNDRGDNAYGFGDFLYSVSLILFDNAAGFSVLISVINIFGCVVVFDDFIFNHAHAGFFHCHFRERNTRLVGGDCGGFENLVYLFLRIGREFTLSVLYSCDSRFERFDAVDYLSFFVFHRNLLYFVLFFLLDFVLQVGKREREIFVLNRHAFGNLQLRAGKTPHGSDSAFYHLVRRFLRRGGGNGENAEFDLM